MDGFKVQILEVVRAAVPGLEHFIQETLAFEALSDSARIEWAVLIQHITKIQHNKLSLHECVSKIQSEQSEEARLPTLLTANTTSVLECVQQQLTPSNEGSQSNGMQAPVSSSVSHFDTSNLDLSLDKSLNSNPLDMDTQLLSLAQSELLVNEQSLSSMVSPDFQNPTDSANSELSGGAANDSMGEQESFDPSNASRPYSCQYCAKRFIRKQHLRQHLTIHTGDKPYHCSLCDRRFIYPSVLREHLKLHLSKPFSCSFCSQKFIHKKSYEQHLLSHKNRSGSEKPFVCSHCNKSFRTRWLLKAHVKKCHVPPQQGVSGVSGTLTNSSVLPSPFPNFPNFPNLQALKPEPIVIQDN